MRYTVHEIFNEVAAAKNKEEKIAILRKNNNQTIFRILRLCFDPAFALDLPEGAPPLKIDRNLPAGVSDTNLYAESRRLYIFEKKKQLPRVKKESLFVQFLEGLHYSEAELIIAAKDGKISKRYKGLTEALVREAFPGLLPEVKEKVKTPLAESKTS